MSEVDKRSRIQWDGLESDGTNVRRYYYDNGTQASQAFPLYFDLIEENPNHYETHVLHWLLDDILLKYICISA